jgi:hypothetical protein
VRRARRMNQGARSRIDTLRTIWRQGGKLQQRGENVGLRCTMEAAELCPIILHGAGRSHPMMPVLSG